MNSLQKDSPQPTAEARKANRRLWLGRAGCLLGMSAALFGLLLGRMSYLWVAFDVFAQFTVQFLLLFAAFALGLLMPRAKVAASLTLFVVFVLGYGLWPRLEQSDVMAARANAGAAGSIKVLSFNTWLSNSTPKDVEDEIRRVDADVVALVEFGQEKLPMLKSLRAIYPYQADCEGANHCAFAILSKIPVAAADRQLIWEGPPYMRIVLGGDYAGLNVFAVHTTRFPHSRAQFRQMKALSRLLQETGGPKLVMGDFNATPYSRMTAILENEVALRRFTSLPSWPAFTGVPQLAIDHIFASEGISAVEGPVLGNAVGSDHFPVTMRLSVPQSLLAVN